MNYHGNNNIPSSVKDDSLITQVTEDACNDIKNKYILKMPDTWNIELGTKRLKFSDIRQKMIDNGLSTQTADSYYGGPSSIITDAHIIWLIMVNGGTEMRKPLFLGEMKKQGTNDIRIMEGKKKQAVGNAAPDRVAKNFAIAADYCRLSDTDFFPYCVFLHGCDFDENDITETTKAKLSPFFGELNKLNPFFDKDIFWGLKGGSCFYQSEEYSYGQLYEVCHKCCEIGITHYMEKFAEK